MWRKQVEEQGFSVIPAVLAGSEVESHLAVLNNQVSKRTRAGARHLLAHAGIAALARDPRLLRVAREILGCEPFLFRATLFDKSPSANWLVAWHQDTALPLRERQERPGWGPWSVKAGLAYAHAPANALGRVLALRVHLDDSTAENGPLRVLPGTHRLGVLSDDEIEQLAAKIAPTECVAPRGAVVAMRPLIVHASSKSKVNAPRRVLHIEYAESKLVDRDLELAVA